MDKDQCSAAVMKTLRSLLQVKGDPDMVQVDRHQQGLPLYHGAYPALTEAINDRLQSSPGLHLEANYRGGISIRDRILCAYQAVDRIESLLAAQSPSSAGQKIHSVLTPPLSPAT